MNRTLGTGSISSYFRELGIFEFESACEWVRALPYQRNSSKEDCFIVLKESCGTCSSKHELIKRLAEENEIEGCKLILCMFKMSRYNTPKVKPVLEAYELDYIPEAHTYVTLDEEVHDLTFPDHPELLYQKDIIYTEEISANQIKSYKVETHKKYLKQWVKKVQIHYSFEDVWKIREACIQALS